MMRMLLILVIFIGGCGASTQTVTNAAIGTGLAAVASGVSRSQGDCYATCTHGLVCNHQTGRCETRLCANGCTSGQSCDQVSGRCEEITIFPGSQRATTTSPAPQPLP